MSAAALRTWMEGNGLTVRQAAAALHVSPTSIQRWIRTGAPYYIGLAVSALKHGLEPFGG